MRGGGAVDEEMLGGEVTRVQGDLRQRRKSTSGLAARPSSFVASGPASIRPNRGPSNTSTPTPVTTPGDSTICGLNYRGDLRAFCDELKRKGVRMAIEPWEFKPGMVLCYVAAPDGVSIELIQVGD